MTKLWKLISAAMLVCVPLCASAQYPPGGPADIAGTFYASNFAGWTIAQGNNGPFAWSSSSVCLKASSGGVGFQPFVVGSPIRIVDTASPSHSENVTVTAVRVNGSGCAITTTTPTYQHLSFYLTSATGGLQEAINFSKQNYGVSPSLGVAIATADWERLGGTTAMIVGAAGGSNVSILDLRTSCPVAYTWNGSVYTGINLCNGGGGTTTLTLTTTGTSGPSTLTGDPTVGYALNVPNYATGGGSGCVPSAASNSVLYSPSGTNCSGDNALTYTGTSAGSGLVLMNQGNKLEIDGVDNINYVAINGDQMLIKNFGSDSAHGSTTMIPYTANQSDSLYSGLSDRIIDFDALFEIDHNSKSGTGFLAEPAVGNGITADTMTGFQAGAISGGGTAAKVYGFTTSEAGTQATTEEFSFYAKTVPDNSINANYCDFMARTDAVSPVLHESFGCGSTHASTFNGPVTVPNLTVTGTCTGCGAGGGGLSGQTTGYLPKATSATTSTTSSALEDTGSSLIYHGTGTQHGLSFAASPGGLITPLAGSAGIGTDASGNWNFYENGGSWSRPCTLGNGLCTGTPGGSNTQIQFNDAGAFGGDADFLWNKTTKVLTLSTPTRIEAGDNPDTFANFNFNRYPTTPLDPGGTNNLEAFLFSTYTADCAGCHDYGLNAFSGAGGSHVIHHVVGLESTGAMFGSAGAFETAGAQIVGAVHSTGAVTTLEGATFVVFNDAAGTVGESDAINVLVPTNTGGGSLGTQYGIHIHPQLGTNLYSEGVSSANLFDGKVTAGSIVDSGLTPSTSPICPNGTGGALTTAGCTGGAAPTVASSETVASSATPTFSTSFNVSYNVLTANVTSFTLAAGSDGQSKTLTFCQNGTGGFTVAAPANVHGFFTVSPTASKCNSQHFNYSTAQTAWLADSAGVIGE